MAPSAYQAELEASLPSGWKVVPLADVAFFQEGPGILAKDFHDEGVPLIRLKGVEGDFVTLTGCNYLSPTKVAEKWSHFQLQRGDLVISTSASFGRVSEVTEESEGAIPYTGLIRFRSKSEDLDSSFLRAFLGSAAFMQQVEAMASGSVIRHFGPMHLKQMALPLPPIDEQRAIGEMSTLIATRLSSLRESNITLDAIASALFQSWFVDFNGVPLEQRQSSELGLIPEEWAVRTLDSIADFLNGLALQRFPPESETDYLPVIKIAQLRAGNTDGADKASSRLKPEYIVKDGDVLFSWSGSLEVAIWTGGEGALNQHLFKVTSGEVPKWFYYFATRKHLPDFRAIAAGKATTMGHIQRGHLTAAKVVVPTPDVMAECDATMAALLDQLIENAVRIRTLAIIRDTLLPRLVSGRLRERE